MIGDVLFALLLFALVVVTLGWCWFTGYAVVMIANGEDPVEQLAQRWKGKR